MNRTAHLWISAAFAVFGGLSLAQAGINGPVLPYEGVADSPIRSDPSFTLISMTALPDGVFSVPGITLSAPGGAEIIGPGGAIDSVDGLGNNGHSLFSPCGSCGLTFTFNSAVLGFTPEAAGIAWTDGLFNIHFSAIDAHGNSIGSISDHSGCDFSCGDGNPLNYRLFWATSTVGIESITIWNDSGGIEVDHLQFALPVPSSHGVPEPSTASLLLLGAGAVLARVTRRRKSALLG